MTLTHLQEFLNQFYYFCVHNWYLLRWDYAGLKATESKCSLKIVPGDFISSSVLNAPHLRRFCMENEKRSHIGMEQFKYLIKLNDICVHFVCDIHDNMNSNAR